MEWMDGKHLSEFTKEEFSREDGMIKLVKHYGIFICFKMHGLKEVHDPGIPELLIDKIPIWLLLIVLLNKVPEEFYIRF
jgi:hypothetical protein